MKNYRAGKSAKTPTVFETKMAKGDALFLTIMANTISENMNRRETGQLSLILIELKVTTLLVKCLKLGKIIDSTENQGLTSY